ncbi:Ankyrin [Shewanella woodyi ATCC 51908]|uniref:Ankyrin n=2 Tax=Shewanella woodyi TaxID=60961 RepID=B1KGR9_SHEWM|nr:Ankyrin [Shewanella woodyi ATCC 51908]
MRFKRTFTLGLSLLLGLFSACYFSAIAREDTNMKAELFFEPNMVQLLKSIQADDISTAKQLIAEGVELNILGNEEITPLLWLITQTNDLKATQRALDLGADPNFSDGDGDNAVTLVARDYAPEWLEMLLEAGGNPNSIDSDGMPAMFDAIGGENWDNINTLLEYGADVNLKDRSGSNSALYPTYIMKYEFAYFFLLKGADPYIYDDTGSDLAWSVYEPIEDGIIAPDSFNYPWVMKIKQHLIDQGVKFPPPTPQEVRAMWEKNGRPAN